MKIDIHSESLIYNKSMNWTTDQPTKPGYYWAYKKTDLTIEIIKLDKFYLEDCYGECKSMDFDCGVYLDEFSYFMGPLELPKAPMICNVGIYRKKISAKDMDHDEVAA